MRFPEPARRGSCATADHRFEWTRAEFQAWAAGVAARFGYRSRFLPVGPRTRRSARPQMAVFGLERGMSIEHSRTLPRRPDRPLRLRQVHVCAQAFPADRGAVVGLLPRPGVAMTRTTRRSRTMPSRCCTSSPRKRLAAGRLTVVDATNVQPKARKPLVELAREYHCLPVAIVLNLPETALPGAQPRRGRTGTSAPRHPPAALAAAPVAARPGAGRLPPRLRARDRRGGRGRRDSSGSRSGTTSGTSTARSTSSATCTAAATNWRRCSATLGYDAIRRTMTGDWATGSTPPGGPQGRLPGRPGGPWPAHPRHVCGW